MSVILDALRRAEQERKLGQAPSVQVITQMPGQAPLEQRAPVAVWLLLAAVVVAIAATLWFDDRTIGFIIAAAMIINLITAALAGALLPMIMQKLKIDPALAGGVALTTVTDVIGFMSFLGLATYFYA